jgi:hypothetical protein
MFLTQKPMLHIRFSNFRHLRTQCKFGPVNIAYPSFYKFSMYNTFEQFSYNFYLSDIVTAVSLNMAIANNRYLYKLQSFI